MSDVVRRASHQDPVGMLLSPIFHISKFPKFYKFYKFSILQIPKLSNLPICQTFQASKFSKFSKISTFQSSNFPNFRVSNFAFFCNFPTFKFPYFQISKFLNLLFTACSPPTYLLRTLSKTGVSPKCPSSDKFRMNFKSDCFSSAETDT